MSPALGDRGFRMSKWILPPKKDGYYSQEDFSILMAANAGEEMYLFPKDWTFEMYEKSKGGDMIFLGAEVTPLHWEARDLK